MKNLTDTIKKLSHQQLKELKKTLEIKETSRNTTGLIYERLLSYPGMALVISRLNHYERIMLLSAYKEKNGITYEELGKICKLDTGKIEKYANNLSNKLLIYVLKNRQKLSNKLDKVYLIQEIRNLLNPLDNDMIVNHYREINKSLEIKEIAKYRSVIQAVRNNPSIKLIENIFNSGGLILLKELNNHIPKKSCQKILSGLVREKYLHIFHDLSESGETAIILDKKIFIALAASTLMNSDENINVNNGYNFLINLLRSYDTSSTFGLFLTKQNAFRKIDRKHLEDSMINITNLNGVEFDPCVISQLSLYTLFIQRCIEINNDAVVISLKNIRDLFNDPFKWLSAIIELLQDPLPENALIKPPFEIPGYELLVSAVELINRNHNSTYEYMESAFSAKYFSQLSSSQFSGIKEIRQRIKKNYQVCMNFLCISGIIEIENSMIRLSDIGLKIADRGAEKVQRTESPDEEKSMKKIYLDSDFTMIIPKKEIPPDALYHILTHTETMKDDIILHTRINRESILTSLKRGMSNDKFFSVLKKFLKTEIPSNLNFLISEWLNQSIKLRIFNATVLKTNPSFIDKIFHSKIKNSIIKRLSNQYAIIDKKFMDRIIKMAKENDAVINLFDESEDYD